MAHQRLRVWFCSSAAFLGTQQLFHPRYSASNGTVAGVLFEGQLAPFAGSAEVEKPRVAPGDRPAAGG